jgi:hypothetical protein
MTKRSLAIGVLSVIIATCTAILMFIVVERSFRTQTKPSNNITIDAQLSLTTPTNSVRGMPNASTSTSLNRTKLLIQQLRIIATKTNDIQSLLGGNEAIIAELRTLGPENMVAFLDEIADRTSPASLRILLIEMVAHLDSQHDPRVGQAFMAIITDATDDKDVRMRALLWIPDTGSQADGAKLLEMLPKQVDTDLEFGIVRSLRGFKVAGSVDVLAGELSDEKGHLIRIAAYHALASQGDDAALAVLQKSVVEILAGGIQESQLQENAVAVHGIMALGELPNSSSLPLLEKVANNPAYSVSIRSTAFDSIAAIGGMDAQQFLRRALKIESDESVLVFIAHALTVVGQASDAPACLEKAAMVSDSYTKNELLRAAHALQKKS